MMGAAGSLLPVPARADKPPVAPNVYRFRRPTPASENPAPKGNTCRNDAAGVEEWATARRYCGCPAAPLGTVRRTRGHAAAPVQPAWVMLYDDAGSRVADMLPSQRGMRQSRPKA